MLGANDRVRLGFIGVGNRGDQVLDAFLKHSDAEVVAICDIYQPYLDFAAKKIGTNPKQFKDYRKLLELKDVDAVVIATPDHWHALQTIDACEAGKDVYVEKPLSLRVAEGRTMVEAVKRHKRVCQVGMHRRSSAMCREMAEFVRGGGLGKVTACARFHIQNEWPKGIGNPPDSEPPPGFDWDAWLGPAPKVPYNQNRTFYQFRWFYDYSGGQITNFGVHYLDLIHWALGQSAPLAVTAMGGKFAVEDNREMPDTMEVLWHYPGRHAGHLHPVQRQRRRRGGQAVRDRVPRHQGHALPAGATARRWCRRTSRRTSSRARSPIDRKMRARLAHGRGADDRGEEGRRPRRHRRPRPQLPRLRQEPRRRATATSRAPTAAPAPRSLPTSPCRPSRTWNGTPRPRSSPTTPPPTSSCATITAPPLKSPA